MLRNEKPKFVLKHYHESWWKVEGAPIWYLGGPSLGEDYYQLGKWYFSDEGEQFSQAFDTYDLCKAALDQYGDYLNSPCQS